MTIVTCTGVDDTAAVQAALNSGGVVELQGPAWCNVTEPLVMNVPDTTLLLGTHIASPVSPVINLASQNLAILGNNRRMKIHGPGTGILVNGSSIYLDLLQLNTSGTAVDLASGAGLWASRLHLNGVPGANSYAFLFRQWDTAFIRELLSEEHDHGLRFGIGAGNVHNIQMASVILDRLNHTYGQALRLEADPGISIGNIQSANLWASQGQHSMTMVASPGGSINNIQLENSYFTDFVYPAPQAYGNVVNFQQGKILY